MKHIQVELQLEARFERNILCADLSRMLLCAKLRCLKEREGVSKDLERSCQESVTLFFANRLQAISQSVKEGLDKDN